MTSKIYLLHNGVNKGEFFSDIRSLAKSLIDYAAIPKEHPLVCDDCMALEISEVTFDPEYISIVDGKVSLEFDEDSRLTAIHYEDWENNDDDDSYWLYPDDDCFDMRFLEEGLTELGM